MDQSARIRELEEALRPFAALEYDSTIEEAWQNMRAVQVISKYKKKPVINPADIKRAAQVLRGR
jgi:hypothetical protein